MITTLFGRSNPVNYFFIVLLLTVCLGIYTFSATEPFVLLTWASLSIKALFFSLFLLFLSQFISIKNQLVKDHAYVLYFFVAFILYIPSIFTNIKLLSAAFFVMLAIRRLISVQTLTNTKQKILDASIWVFTASIIDFWCIVFIVPVFLTIIFHVAADYRNWFIPFIAAFTVSTIFLMFVLIFDITWFAAWVNQQKISLNFSYFSSKTESAAVGLYVFIALVFMLHLLLQLPKKQAKSRTSIVIVLLTWFVSLSVFMLTPQKSNAVLVYSLFPSAVLAGHFMETHKDVWLKDVIALVVLCAGVFLFTLHLT